MAERGIGEIAKIVEARPILADQNTGIKRLLLDSRQFSSAEGVLFFALRGKNHDGHQYIRGLIQKGVRNFVVEELPESGFPECNFLIVPNALAALQKLARQVRLSSDVQIVAITGSNGKTIVKEWLGQVLQTHFSVCRSPKSYNSQVGVPLSVWELERHHQVGIFEAGISQPGEMEVLEEILKPQIGIFTNIGSAHDEFFENHQQKIHEKLKLFEHAEKLVYRLDEGLLSEEIRAWAEENEVELLSWSLENDGADLAITEQKQRGDKTSFSGNFRGNEVSIEIPFVDEASIENALHCWRLALELEVPAEACQKAFFELQPVEMRLEMKTGLNQSLIINDAYNADLESLRLALHFLEHHGGSRTKFLIISDMLQTGLEPGQLYQRIAEIVNRFDLQQVIGIGPGLMKSGIRLDTDFDLYPSTEDFLANIFKYHFRDAAVLLKGARPFRFEQISSRLEEKTHETVLNIYLDRLVHNLNYFRSKLSPGTRIMAMVKAFSYGSGSYEIASLLEFHQVDYLGVAYADEGVELRQAGISLPILVLSPEPYAFEDMIHFKLEPEIYNLGKLRLFEDAVRKAGLNEKFPIHLKLETGMNRLGFQESDLTELIEVLNESAYLRVSSAFSHLAASEDPAEKEFTERQIATFKRMTQKLREGIGNHFFTHLCNSSGISHYPEAHFDMVRLGIGLYGVGSNEVDKQQLQVVCELKATVSQVKNLEVGETVSYGRTFKADKPTRIAVISIGYADGFRRSLSNGVGEVVIRGKRFPVVGRVCMDMLMADVTNSPVQEGDEVEIFGKEISLYELADKMQTIPYEVLTGIGQRVKRVYFME